MGCFCSKAKFPYASHGVDPILGSDPRSFRYENQPEGPRPVYYNPYTGSVHRRVASATWEAFPGEYAGLPRPVPKAREEKAPRPAKVRPKPQRASLDDVKWKTSVKPGKKLRRKRGPQGTVVKTAAQSRPPIPTTPPTNPPPTRI
ncbi:hypothetical protein ACJ41O_000922 [Fusarium nematophilum]